MEIIHNSLFTFGKIGFSGCVSSKYSIIASDCARILPLIERAGTYSPFMSYITTKKIKKIIPHA